MKDGFTVKFRINYVIFGLLLIIIGGLVVFLWFFPEQQIDFTIIDIMAYSTGSVAILTLIYHSLTLESSRYFHSENLRINKNQYSYDVVSRINEPEMVEVLHAMYVINESKDKYFKNKDIDVFLTYLKEHPKKRARMVMLLNYFEHVSILVFNNHVEENIIKENFGSLFVYNYTLLKPYIDYKQKTNRTTWIKFEELAGKWAKEK